MLLYFTILIVIVYFCISIHYNSADIINQQSKRDDGDVFQSQYQIYTDALLNTISIPLQVTSSMFDYFYYGSTSSNYCPYNTNIIESVKRNLHQHIKGQDEGIEAVINAISAWEFQRRSTNGVSEPLVLAITGPTGVGKSETAYRIAEAALSKRTRIGNTKKRVPNGLLTLRGEDFTSGNIQEIQSIIKTRIIDHLTLCDGNAVIIIDEVQKILPGSLEVLLPAMDARGSISNTKYIPITNTASTTTTTTTRTQTNSVLSYISSMLVTTTTNTYDKVFKTKNIHNQENINNKEMDKQENKKDNHKDNNKNSRNTFNVKDYEEITTTVSTENVIFILISDIGGEKMIKLILNYQNRSLIPQTIIRNEIKNTLDEQWSRLKFSKLIKEIIPYMPLEPEHIRLIMTNKLALIAKDFEHINWSDLVVDEDVVQYLTSPTFIKYSFYQMKNSNHKNNSSSNNNSNSTHDANTNINNDFSPTDSTSSSTTTITAGGETMKSNPTVSMGGTSRNDIFNSTKAKIFATWGARSIENAGPLQDLKGLINRIAQPWKPAHILHIGMTKDSNCKLRNKKWGTNHIENDLSTNQLIYIQWCNPELFQCISSPSNTTSPEQYHNNDHCNTFYNNNTTIDKDSFIKQPNNSNHSESYYHRYNNTIDHPIIDIDDSIAFSDACETIWFGAFPSSS